METLLNSIKMEGLRRKLGFENYFIVYPVSKIKGLTLLWKSKVNLKIYIHSLWHVNGWIMDLNKSSRWLLIWFYNHPDASKMMKSWALLDRLNPIYSAWCICGDFNEIIFHHEKKWRKTKPKTQMKHFRNALNKQPSCL